MWFKNLTLLRLVEPLPLDGEALAARLQRHAFQPCPTHQASVAGWTAPLGRKALDLVHGVGGRWLVCLRTDEKILPAMAVNHILTERIAMIEDQEGRPVRRRERRDLRDHLVQELLPRALIRGRLGYAYLDPAAGWLAVDSASERGVEHMTAMLRKALEALPVAPVRPAWSPAAVMTAWLTEGSAPQGFALGDVCELRDESGSGGVVRCRDQDLTGDELRGHLQAGKRVARLGLIWDGRVSFVLDEALVVRRLRFLDIVREPLQDTAAVSPEAVFDSEFAVMSAELAAMWPRLLEQFGGQA